MAAAAVTGSEDAASVKVRNEQELEDLLTEKYNYLVRHICPREFIPPLISKHVLTTADKEEIQKQITYIDRAGGANVVRVQSFITLSPSPLIPWLSTYVYVNEVIINISPCIYMYVDVFVGQYSLLYYMYISS